jgi:hypothetical protein
LAFAALPIQAVDVGKIHWLLLFATAEGVPGVDAEIARRCQVTHPFVGKLRSVTSIDARTWPATRTFTPPKTGKPTKTGNIGKRPAPVAVEQPHQAACLRLAILATVARLHPVAACMLLQDWPAAIMRAMPSLRSVSSGRPL